MVEEAPEELVLVKCPDCGRVTSSEPSNFKLVVRELKCPWCGTVKGVNDVIAEYKKLSEGEEL